jgi:hypothetical protein
MAAPVTVIPTALRGNMSATVSVPAGNPTALRFKLVSPDYPTDATLTYSLVVEQSFDGGQSFAPWPDFKLLNDHGGGLGAPGKFGVPGDGLPEINVSYDGTARLARANVTVNRPFTWGLTATIL